MKRVSYGKRPDMGSDSELRWFADDREGATKLDPDVIWLEFLEDKYLQKRWERVKARVLADFIKEHPGRRPAAWWRFDSPEPRQRKPVADWKVLVPDYVFGLAVIGEDAEYESQGAYLRRHGLLEPGEAAHSDFKPEFVAVNDLIRHLRLVGGIVE